MKKIFAVLFISILIINLYACSGFTEIKYSTDYSAVDYVKAQNISFGLHDASKDELEKYDMNEDGAITHFDTEIIRQMLDGYYDEYKISKNQRRAIKYIEE